MYTPLTVKDEKQEMIEAIIARTEYVSLSNDDLLFEKLRNLPYRLLVWKYNSIVKSCKPN